MDATATPRGISLAVGELGARGRPINKQCTAVRISSTVESGAKLNHDTDLRN